VDKPPCRRHRPFGIAQLCGASIASFDRTLARAEAFAAALARDLDRCAAIHAVMARELAACS